MSSTVLLDGLVGPAECRLLPKEVGKILGKLVSAFGLDHFQEGFNHCLLLLISLLSKLPGFGYLQDGLFIWRMVFSKFVVEPHFHLS